MHFLANRRTDIHGASNSRGLRTAAALAANARHPATQRDGDGFGRVSDPLPLIEAPLSLQPPPVKNNTNSNGNGNSTADWSTGWIPLALQGQLRRKRQKHQFDDAEEEQQGPQKKKYKKRRIIFLGDEVKREAKKEEPNEDVYDNNQVNAGVDDHDNCQQQSSQGSKQPSPIAATDVVTPVTGSEASSSQNSAATSSESEDDNASLSLTPTDPIDRMAHRLSKTVVIGKPCKNRWHPDSQFADPVHEIVEEDELSVGSGVGAREQTFRGSPMTVPLVVTEWISQKRAPVETLGSGGDFLEAQKGFDVDEIGTAKQRKVTGFSQIINNTTSETQLQQQKDQATLSTADTQTEEATIATSPLPTEKAAEMHAQQRNKYQSTAPLSAIDARSEAVAAMSPLQTDNESEVQTNPSLQEEQASSSTSDAWLQKSPASPKTGTKNTNDSNELSEEAGTPTVESESDSQMLQEEKGRLSEAKGKLQQMKLKLQLIQGNHVRSDEEDAHCPVTAAAAPAAADNEDSDVSNTIDAGEKFTESNETEPQPTKKWNEVDNEVPNTDEEGAKKALSAHTGRWTDEERERLRIALVNEADWEGVERFVGTRRFPAIRKYAPRAFPKLFEELMKRLEKKSVGRKPKAAELVAEPQEPSEGSKSGSLETEEPDSITQERTSALGEKSAAGIDVLEEPSLPTRGNDDTANQSARKVNGNVRRNDTEEPMQFDMPDYDAQEEKGESPAESSALDSRDNASASRASVRSVQKSDEDRKPRAKTRKSNKRSAVSGEARSDGEESSAPNRNEGNNPEEVLEISDSDDEVQAPPPPPQQPNGQNEIVEIDDSEDESEVQAPPPPPQQQNVQNEIVEIDDSDDETETESEVQAPPPPQPPNRQNEIVEIDDSDDDETETDNVRSVPESPQASSREPNRPERAAASYVVMADRQRAGRRSRRETSVRPSAQETGPANRRTRRTLQTSPTHSTQSAPDDNRQSQSFLEGSNLNRSEETSTGKRPRRKTLQRSASNLAPAGKKHKGGDEDVPAFDGTRDGNTENLEEASVDESASSPNKRLRPPRVSQSPESFTSEYEGSTVALDTDQGAPVPSITLPASLSLPRRVSRSPAKAVTESSSFSDSSTSNETLADIEAAETGSVENGSSRDESTVGEQEEATETGSSSNCDYPADNAIGKCKRIYDCPEMSEELRDFQAANHASCQSPYSLKKFLWLWDEVQRRELKTTTDEIEDEGSFKSANKRMSRNVGGNQGKALYGRMLPEAMEFVLAKIMELNSDHVFMDFGHGIGNASMQAAFTYGCKSKGVELIEARYLASEAFQRTVAKLANQKRASQPENWDHKAGLIELKHGSLLDPRLHEWLTSDVDRVFVNNYSEVMARRSEPRGNTCTVDAKIAALFANMKPGTVMVTLEPILALGKSKQDIEKERRNQGYDTHGCENNASFYEMDTLEVLPINESVSWSEGENERDPLKVYKYTRLQQAGVANGSVTLCRTRDCEWARNATPIPATTVGRHGVEINLSGCGGCHQTVRNTRGKAKCKSPEKLKEFDCTGTTPDNG